MRIHIRVKKLLSLFLAVVITFVTSIISMPQKVKAADKVVFTVSSDKAELVRGDEFTVSVDMSGNETATDVSIKLFYDSNQLETSEDKVTGGEAFDGALFPPAAGAIGVSKGEIDAIIMKAEYNNPVKNGNIFKAVFKVKDTAKGAVSIDLIADEVIAFDENSQETFLESTVQNINPQIVVTVPVTGITLNKQSMVLAKDAKEQLTATVTPDDATGNVTWSSDKERVATVDDKGVVTAVGQGDAVITAEAGGYKAKCAVKVNVPLKDISIKTTATAIKKGQTAQLSVVYNPEDTTERGEVTWSSSGEYATVNANGLVTAVKDGVETITATVNGKTATIDITVKEIKLESIDIKEATTIHKGEEETLEVTFNPNNTTDDKTVEWTSSDSSIVVVDGSGKLTALGVGEAKVTAEVGNFVDECIVTVDSPLKSIDVEQTELNLIKNQSGIIRYKLNPADTTYAGTISFESDNDETVSVDEDGAVTAHSAGQAVITLKSEVGITAEVVIKVNEIPIDSIVLDAVNKKMEVGTSSTITATVGPENTTDEDKTVVWKSSDESIVSVTTDADNSMTATLTANKGGTAVITATTANGKEAQCTVFVPIHMTGISLPETAELLKGKTRILDLICTPKEHDDDATVIWTSSDPEVAIVDENTGMISAIKAGTTVITAATTAVTNSEGKPFTAETTVTVKENHLTDELAEQIKFDKFSELYIGQSANMTQHLNLNEIIKDNEITDEITVVWNSSDMDSVSIDQTGRVLGLAEGKTTILAEITAIDASGNKVNYKASTKLDVKPVEGLAFDKVIKEMTVGATDELKVICEPNGVTNIDVEWESSEPQILSVENGVLKALKAGKATITAKAGGKEISCTISVKEKENSKEEINQQKPNNQNNSNKKNEAGIVKTGDTSNNIFYIVLMVSMLAVILLTLTRKGISRKR